MPGLDVDYIFFKSHCQFNISITLTKYQIALSSFSNEFVFIFLWPWIIIQRLIYKHPRKNKAFELMKNILIIKKKEDFMKDPAINDTLSCDRLEYSVK